MPLLVTLDVSSFYTNKTHNEGINACPHFLDTRNRTSFTISTETLCDLIRMILTRNNRPFYSCDCVTRPMNGSEATGDIVLIQTSLLFLCKCGLVSITHNTIYMINSVKSVSIQGHRQLAAIHRLSSLSGRALRMVKDLGYSENAYARAKEKLENKFGGERRIQLNT